MNIVIATIKSCHINKVKKLIEYNKKGLINKHKYFLYVNNSNLTYDNLKEINPDYIFFIHWSWYIPEEIFSNFKCILFHTSNLPYGKGGSPIQNNIIDKIYYTSITALKVTKNFDSGEIYYKYSISLHGSCDEILIRISNVIFNKMIPYILLNNPVGVKQETGKFKKFKRRTEQDSYLDENKDLSLTEIYDHIRMLDGEGYPRAKLIFGNFVLEFSRASLKEDLSNGKYIISDVIIKERKLENE